MSHETCITFAYWVRKTENITLRGRPRYDSRHTNRRRARPRYTGVATLGVVLPRRTSSNPWQSASRTHIATLYSVYTQHTIDIRGEIAVQELKKCIEKFRPGKRGNKRTPMKYCGLIPPLEEICVVILKPDTLLYCLLNNLHVMLNSFCCQVYAGNRILRMILSFSCEKRDFFCEDKGYTLLSRGV